MSKGIVKNIFSDTVVYGFTKYFAVLASVFLTPIYTRILSKTDFGIMDIFNTWNAMIIAVLPLGLFNALLRFFPEIKNNLEKRKDLFGAILSSILVACLIYTISILAFKDLYFKHFLSNQENHVVFYYSIYIVIFAVLHAYFLQILQIRFEKYKYMIVSFINFLILTILGFYLVYSLDQGIVGFFRASAVSFTTSNIVGAMFVHKDLHIRFNISQVKTLISYSIHFVTVFFLLQLSQVVDRYIINKYLDLSQVGIYSVAVRIGNLLQIAISSFGTAWMPYAMSIKDQKDARQLYKKMLNIFVVSFVAIISSMLLFRKEIILLFAPDYMDAYNTIFWILMSNFTMGLIFVFTLGIQIIKKSKFLSYAAFFSVTTNFLISISLVSTYGIQGVAIGTFCGAVVWIGIQHYFSQKYYKIEFQYLKTFIVLLLLSIPLSTSVLLDKYFELGFSTILVKSIMTLTFFGIAIYYVISKNTAEEIPFLNSKMVLNIKKAGFAFIFLVIFAVVKSTELILRLIPINRVIKKKKAVLYLACYFPDNAGYHYRITKWQIAMQKLGFKIKVKRVIKNKENFEEFINFKYRRMLCISMWKRYWQILSSIRYEKVIVRRTVLLYNDYGNLFFEKFLLTLHPNAILDFDDDMDRHHVGAIKSIYGKFLMERVNKFSLSIRLYRRFIVGSNYLKQYVVDKNKDREIDVVLIPTCVDYPDNEPVKYGPFPEKIIFGWIGSDGNQVYLEMLIEGLNKVYEKYNMELVVISGMPYQNENANFPIRNVKWSLETEVDSLKMIHIGLMPLKNIKLAWGKCGFKLIQYMGLGIVSIANAIGANKEIIENENEGFLIRDDQYWVNSFLNIIERWDEFEEIGKMARIKIAKNYTFRAHLSNYIQFLDLEPNRR